MNVSIIIPVYNVAPYIEDCLKSVMRQTYTGSMECLLVDDCGTDDSMAIAERMIEEYEGTILFRILHHEHNRGLSAARNTGTLEAVGDYLYYIDSDDEITDDCINCLMGKVQENPGIEMVQGNAIRHPMGLEAYPLVRKIVMPVARNQIETRACFYQYHQMYVNVWNKLLRRDLIVDNDILCKEGLLFEDNLWCFVLLKYLKRAAFILDVTYHQKKRPYSITMSADDKTKMLNYSTVYREIANCLTAGFEREELRCYGVAVCAVYFDYVSIVPQFDEVFELYREKGRQFAGKKLRVMLEVIGVLRHFKWGDVVWRLLCRIAKKRRRKG